MNNFKDKLSIILNIKYSKFINKKAKFCKYNDCEKEASYNFENCKSRIYCNSHKLNNMNVLHRQHLIMKIKKINFIVNYIN